MKTKFTEFKAAVAATSSRPSKTRLAHGEPVAAQAADPPTLYHGFEGQYIDGSWRPGKHGGVQVGTDPYSGETPVETIMANQTAPHEAYHPPGPAQTPAAQRRP